VLAVGRSPRLPIMAAMMEQKRLDQATVLIISDDAAFSGAVAARWQTERHVPAFTLMSGGLCHGLDPEGFDLAIVGGVSAAALPSITNALEAAERAVVFVLEGECPAQTLREAQSRGLVIRRREDWLDTLVMLASEVLRRCEATVRARNAEEASASLQAHATLGRYVLEMRHTLNNTLTSVLGNSELLLLEPGPLSSSARSQLETIRNMALRMHEILQRFSSLEKELNVVALQAGREASFKSRSAAAGS